MTPTRIPLSDLAVVALIVLAAALIAGGGVVGLIAFASVAQTAALMGAPAALACAALFVAHYLVFRSCPPHLGAAAGYAAGALWLWGETGMGDVALIFALPGAFAGYLAAALGRRMLRAMGHDA